MSGAVQTLVTPRPPVFRAVQFLGDVPSFASDAGGMYPGYPEDIVDNGDGTCTVPSIGVMNVGDWAVGTPDGNNSVNAGATLLYDYIVIETGMSPTTR